MSRLDQLLEMFPKLDLSLTRFWRSGVMRAAQVSQERLGLHISDEGIGKGHAETDWMFKDPSETLRIVVEETSASCAHFERHPCRGDFSDVCEMPESDESHTIDRLMV